MNYKIIIVNLKDRIDRKNNITHLFKDTNFNIYFFEAIHGNKTDLSLEIKNIFNGNDFSSRKGFIGCALSHYNIWLQLIEDNDNDFYIIFEDDITLCNNFEFYLNENIQYTINNINTLDILFTGFTKNKNLVDYDNWNNDEIHFLPFSRNLYSIGGTFGYIITKNGAIKIINSVETNGIKHGIDYFIKINDNILNMVLCKPSIVYSEWYNVNNSSTDTNIQNNFECFNLKDIFDYHNYQFIKNIDQLDNDLEYSKLNIEALISKCNELDYFANGFNTLGFIKSNIDYNSFSISKWFRPNDGLYIKLNRKYIIQIENSNYNILNSLKCMMNIQDFRINNLLIKELFPNIPENSPNKITIYLNENFIDKQSSIHYPYWNINISNSISKDELNKLSILSSYDNSKINKIEFLKYLDNSIVENNDNIQLHVYGNINHYHHFKYNKGILSNKDKTNGLFPYKYILIGNNIWEGILSECLCFYYGDINHGIDSKCIININLNEYENTYQIIKNAMNNNLWESRINDIKKEKYNILHYHSFFPIIEREITKRYIKHDIKYLSNILNTNFNIDKIKFIIHNSKNNYKIIPFVLTMKILGFNIINELSFQNIILEENPIYNDYSYVIIDENWIFNDSYINLINHILYLPDNYDFCYINNNSNNKIINQINSLYYNVKKYYFKCNGPYIISTNGIRKIINYYGNNIYNIDKFDIYNKNINIYDIENLNIYSNKYQLFYLS